MKRVELILKGRVYMCACVHDEADVEQMICKFRRVADKKGLPYTITLTVRSHADNQRKADRNNRISAPDAVLC